MNSARLLSHCMQLWPMNVWSAMGLHLTSLSESRITLQRLLSKWRRQNDRYHFDTRLLKRSASIEMVARDARCKFQVLIKNNSGQCICIVTKQIKWLERHARVSTVSLFDLACYNSDNLFHCIGNSVVVFFIAFAILWWWWLHNRMNASLLKEMCSFGCVFSLQRVFSSDLDDALSLLINYVSFKPITLF